MKKLFAITVLTLSATAATSAFAEHNGKHHYGHKGKDRMWERVDANKDGFVTREESLAANEQMFNKLDTNKDGKISKEERDAHFAEKKAKWEAKKKEMISKYDADKDGKLSKEERKVAKEAYKASKEADKAE